MNADLTPTTLPAPVRKRADPITALPFPHPYVIPDTKRGEPVSTHTYTDPEGAVLFAVCRWHDAKGEKTFMPLVWDGKRYHWKGYPEPRPILNATTLHAHPSAPVLVVSGEKTYDAAQQYLPDGMLVTTWAHGDNSVQLNDWSQLANRRVILWPDNDDSGRKAMEWLAAHLQTLGAVTATVRVPSIYPEKWDLADTLPKGTAAGVTALLVQRLDDLTHGEPTAEREPEPVHLNGHAHEPTPTPPTDDDLGIHEGRPAFIPLGHDGNGKKFFFFTAVSNGIIPLDRAEMYTEKGLLSLNPSPHEWVDVTGKTIQYAPEWKAFGCELMAKCYSIGKFIEGNVIRGVGIWHDQGRIIAHMGREVWVNGEPVAPCMIKSRWIYPYREDIISLKGHEPLTRDIAAQVLAICRALRWENPFHGDALAGLIATAPLCGVLRWRAHGLTAGPRGAGKSWVINELAVKCLGNFAINVLGATSEAGIRSQLEVDARPVLFDENEQSEHNKDRVEKIIELMRAASSMTTAGIAKGSADHGGKIFKLNTMFLGASIGVPIHRPSDLSRTVIMTLRGGESNEPAERAKIRAHFDKIKAMVARLPDDLPQRLLLRMAAMAPVVIKNAALLGDCIARNFSDARTGDQIGVLLAGMYALMSDDVMTEDMAMKRLKAIDWEVYNQPQQTREDIALMSYLASKIVRVEGPQNMVVSRTIGELCAIACNQPRRGEQLSMENARDLLMRYGIKHRFYIGDEEGFMIGKAHQWLNETFRGSDYPGSYYDIIARHPGAKRREKQERFARFAGSQHDWVWLPAGLLTGFEGDGVD